MKGWREWMRQFLEVCAKLRKVRLLLCLFAAACALSAQNPEALLAEGVEQFHEGKYASALDRFTEALKLSPADARAIAYQQLTRAVLGDCAQTLNELVLQARRNPDPELRRQSGLYAVRCLSARGDFPEALPLLADLLNRNPNDADVLYEAAETFNRSYNISIVNLFQRDPSSYRVNQLSAEIMETQGRFGDAATQWKKAIEKNPNALRLHEQLGRAILRESQSPEALENARAAFEAELKLNPQDAVAELDLGKVFFSQQKLDEAAACLEKSLALRPTLAEALVALARVRSSQQKPDAAVKLLQKAIQISPGLEMAHTELIRIYREQGKTKDAQREQAEIERQKKAGTNEALDRLRAK
jgi:tetratricopeptide (TPR) repeat protein